MLDKPLRADLAQILGAGDGDISNIQALDKEEAEPLLGQRSILVAMFAEQSGYAFSIAKSKVVIGIFKRYQARGLSQDEFSSALV